MNEDETFKALKKVTYGEISELYSQWWLTLRSVNYTVLEEFKTDRELFFNSYGWTFEGYGKEWSRLRP